MAMESLARSPFLSCAALSYRSSGRALALQFTGVAKSSCGGLIWQQLGSRRVRVLRRGVESGFWRRNRASGAHLVRARGGDDESDESVENSNEREDASRDEASSKSGFSVFRNALARGAARYYKNLVDSSRVELGVDLADVVDKSKVQSGRLKEVAENVGTACKQRVQQLREEVEEAKKQSQEALVEARENHWPRFIEWNRWELWRVSI